MLESLSSLLSGTPFQWPQIFFVQAGSGVALNSLLWRLLEVEKVFVSKPVLLGNVNQIGGDVTRIPCPKTPTAVWLFDTIDAAQKYFKAESDLLVLLLDHDSKREAEFYKQFGPRSLLVMEIDDSDANLEEIPVERTILISEKGDSFFAGKADFLQRKFGVKGVEVELAALMAQQAHRQLSRQLHQLQAKEAVMLTRQLRLKDPSNLGRLVTRYLQHLETVFEGQLDGEAAGIGYAFGHELPAALEAIQPATNYTLSELQILFKNSKVSFNLEMRKNNFVLNTTE